MSTRWWSALFAYEAMIDAALLTLRIAFVNACAATVLGTLAGIALARHPRFLGRSLFVALILAPLVMPEGLDELQEAPLRFGTRMFATSSFVFLHIPKTGGTFVTRLLRRRLGAEKLGPRHNGQALTAPGA